jgi:hypothetical protein
MSRTKFVLGWTTTILGNVQIVGRPLSAISLSKGYDKHAVEHQLTQAVTIARQMVTETHKLVHQSLTPAIERTMGLPGPLGYMSKMDPVVLNAATTHLKMPNALAAGNAQQWIDLFNYLKQVYLMIGQGIRGSFAIVDIPKADKLDTNGSVSLQNAQLLDATDADGLRIADRGRIHINFHWITTRTPHRVARTIIHEASHKFIGTRDHAYKPDHVAYAGLTPSQARANADSIACFAYYTWKNGAYSLES